MDYVLVKLNIMLEEDPIFDQLKKINKAMLEACKEFTQPFFKMRETPRYHELFRIYRSGFKKKKDRNNIRAMAEEYGMSNEALKEKLLDVLGEVYADVLVIQKKDLYRNFLDAVCYAAGMGYYYEYLDQKKTKIDLRLMRRGRCAIDLDEQRFYLNDTLSFALPDNVILEKIKGKASLHKAILEQGKKNKLVLYCIMHKEDVSELIPYMSGQVFKPCDYDEEHFYRTLF